MKPITPETYEKMNEEFIEKGEAFRIVVPTQEEIDEWRNRPPFVIHDYLDKNGQVFCEKTLLEKLWDEHYERVGREQQATDASTAD